MKKIIATVLAMVMVLALCTTAFAASTTYTKQTTKTGVVTDPANVVMTDKASTKNANGSGSVKGYTDQFNTPYLPADASDYDYKLSAEGEADLYIKSAPNSTLDYDAKAKVFTNVGEGCEQLDVADTTLTYYVVTDDDDNNTYYVKEDATGTNLLVDGKLVSAKLLTVGNENQGLTKHTWKIDTLNKDNTVATYKCKDCGVVATVYKTKDAALAAGATMTDTIGGNVIGWGAKSTTKPADGTTSPKTFDAGIAMYVGMALTSVAGSAVVIGKKKEF